MACGRRRLQLRGLIPVVLLTLVGCVGESPLAPEASPEPEAQRSPPTKQKGRPPQARKIKGQYIVVFSDDVSKPHKVAQELSKKYKIKLRHRYSHTIKGFSANIPDGALAAIGSHPLVRSVEENVVVYLNTARPSALLPPQAGLRVHLVADNLTTSFGDGAGVGLWPSAGTEADAIQTDASRRPAFHAGAFGNLFNGHAHVGFNEGSDNDETLEITGVTYHASATLIAVLSQDDANNHNYGLFSPYGNGRDRGSFVTRRYSNGRVSYWDRGNGWEYSDSGLPTATAHVVVWRVQGSSTVDFQVDGTASGPVSLRRDMRFPFDRYIVGSTEPSSSSRFDGQVAELLFYDRALSDSERDAVVFSLGDTYGIDVGQPGGPPLPPGDPIGLTANAVSNGGIDVTWTDVSDDEDGFRLERAPGPTGPWSEIAVLGANAGSHSDVGLAGGTEYCYRVRAFNANGSSAYSNTGCATTFAAAPPFEPTPIPEAGLRVRLIADGLATSVGDGGEVAAWPNPGSGADAGQASVTRRPTFHAGAVANGFGGHAHVGFNESSDNDEFLEVTGVAPHRSGTLIAVFSQDDANGHNYGLFSPYGNGTDRGSFVTRHNAGAAPLSYWDRTNGWIDSDFTVLAGGAHVAVWRVLEGDSIEFQVDGKPAGGGSIGAGMHQPFDRYIVGSTEPSSGSRFDGQVAELIFYDRAISRCERDDIVAGLGEVYGIAVPAIGGGDCTPPEAPTGLTASAADYRTIELQWTDASADEAGFHVERRLGSAGAFARVASIGPDTTAYTDASLLQQTQYCYRVVAFNQDGSSDPSAAACATTPAAPPFEPLPIPEAGLRVRLIADVLATSVGDGGEVAAWPNPGSGADAGQASVTRRPTFHAGAVANGFGGHAHVGFNESSDNDEFLEVTGVAPHRSGTLIAVFSQDDANGHNYGLFSPYGNGTDRGSFVTRHNAGGAPLSYWDRTNGWIDSDFTVLAGGAHVAVWRVLEGDSIEFQVDGKPVGGGGIGAGMHQPFDRYIVGSTEPSSGSRFDGQVAELIFYDRAISRCERDDIVAGLGEVYGIAVPAIGGGDCTPPEAPTGLTASAADYRTIELQWTDASADEAGFHVERRLGSAGAFARVASIGPDTTAYTDASLLQQTQYCYRVVAFNQDGSSDPSAAACATTPAAPPGACVDTGGHDDLAALWNIVKVGADRNQDWQATRLPGCEIEAWFFGLDSGVDPDHPDLNVVETVNFVASQPGHSGADGNGHGTHTAGTAAARDGNGGVVGVAPGAPVFGWRVCADDGSCNYDDIIAAVDSVTSLKLANPAQPMVVNMSLAGPSSEAMDLAVRRSANAGVVYALAAGNGLLGACLIPNDSQTMSPARVGDDAINGTNGSDGNTRRINGVFAVTSSGQNDADVNCNFGNPVTVAAPGVGIRSTWLNGGYNTISGTSMATPHVAGAALLFLQRHPAATPLEIEQAIVGDLAPWSTDDQPNADGRLDVSGF